MDMPDFEMRIFPIKEMQNIGGELAKSEDFYKPSGDSGALIYLNGNRDVQIVLDRIESAGGKIIVHKTEISPEFGFIGILLTVKGIGLGYIRWRRDFNEKEVIFVVGCCLLSDTRHFDERTQFLSLKIVQMRREIS